MAIDFDLQGKIWCKKSNFLVSPLLRIHNHHITTREPWVPRLLHWPDCFMVSILCAYLYTLECQIEGQACLFIFHFWPTWPKLIWPYLFIFSGVIWEPVLSLNLTEQLKPTETCECWLFYLPFMGTLSLISVYMAVIIHILHEENQSLLKTIVSARRLNKKWFATLTLYSDLQYIL